MICFLEIRSLNVENFQFFLVLILEYVSMLSILMERRRTQIMLNKINS